MKGFTLIPDWMLDLELNATETLILASIYGFTQNGAGVFFGGNKYLAKKAKCSERTVIRTLAKLTEFRYIEETTKIIDDKRVSCYTINEQELAPVMKKALRESSNPTLFESADNLDNLSKIGDSVSKIGDNLSPDNKIYNINNKEKEIKEKENGRHAEHGSSEGDASDIREVFDFYNSKIDEVGSGMPKAQSLSEARRRYIRGRIRDYGLDKVKEGITKASENKFLSGHNGRNWRADLTWLMQPSNFEKVIEGYYDKLNSDNNNQYQNGKYISDAERRHGKINIDDIKPEDYEKTWF